MRLVYFGLGGALSLLLTASLSGCGGGGETTSQSAGTTSGHHPTGSAGSGGGSSSSTGSGGEGGSGGGQSAQGHPASGFVNAGDTVKSPHYKMVFTLGQSTQNQSKTTSKSYRMQGGLVGAEGSLP